MTEAWVIAQARRRGDAVAVRDAADDIEGVTWSALAGKAFALAAGLAHAGVRRGDIVAVRMPPSPQMVALLHALQMLGAAMLPLNLRLTSAELERIVALAAPRLVLDDHGSLACWWGDIPRVHACDDLDSAAASKSFRLPVALDPQAALTVVMTSGSSGAPRAVVLTNANHAAAAAASRARLGHGERDVWLAALPLYHIGGLAILARSALEGSEVMLEPAFDVERASDVIGSRDGRATMVSLVPTMLSRVLDRMTASASSRLRCVLIGGAPLSPALGARALEAGLPVSPTYGMTEACSQLATSSPGSLDAARGRSGRPLDGVEMRIDDADAEGWGEIIVRGPNVMRGYLRPSPESGEAPGESGLLPGGWLRTRDRGRIDERGTLSVAGRCDDVIITGGENVSPVEVEQCLDQHPEVAESLVVGAADSEWGQRIVALVVARRRDRSPSPEVLRAWCRERIAPYKVPRELRFVAELPRTATGKLVRTVKNGADGDLISPEPESESSPIR
jgi:o-succinylbenzoate---CoA ligase